MLNVPNVKCPKSLTFASISSGGREGNDMVVEGPLATREVVVDSVRGVRV